MNAVTRVGLYEFQDHKENILGSGSFATVFRGKLSSTGTPVAIKQINLTGRSENEKSYLNQEIAVMEKVNHPNIVHLHYYMVIGRYLYLVLDYCNGGDLQKYLKSQKSHCVDEDTARHLVCQLAVGLRYLHEKGIVHRDLKPHNLMLDESLELKIGDFGFARKVENEMHSILGSPLYMAPEILTGRKYTSKSDLWSVGCIFYQMLTGESPWNPKDIIHLRQLAANQQDVINFPSQISPLCRDLLVGLLKKDDNKRSSWEQFFDHPYLRPENLSKTTLLAPLEVILPNVTSDLLSSPSTKKPTIHKANSLNTAVPCTMWLQLVVCLYPHGHTVSLYLDLKNTVLHLKNCLARLENVEVEDQLLINESGNQLENLSLLVTYSLNKHESVVYLIPLNFLNYDHQRIPYPIKDLPFPQNTNIIFPPIDSSVNVRDQLRQKQSMYELREKKLEELFQNVMTRCGTVTTLTLHHEYQECAYIALMFKHIPKLSLEISHCIKPCVDLYTLLEPDVIKLNSSLHSILNKLNTTTLHAGIHSSPKVNTLLDFVGESILRNEFEELRAAWTSVNSNYESLKELDTQINQTVVDNVQHKLDNQFFKLIKEGKGALSYHSSTFQSKGKSYHRQLLSLEKEIIHAISDQSLSDTEITALLSHHTYKALNVLFNDCVTQDDLSITIMMECLRAKEDDSFEFLSRLNHIGPILKKVSCAEHITKTLLPSLMNILERVKKCKSYANLGSTYKSLLSEIERRNVFKHQMQKQTTKSKFFFDQKILTESTLRAAFKKMFCDSDSILLSLSTSLHQSTSIPQMTIFYPPIDEDLPDIKNFKIDRDFEDDFLFCSVEDDSQRIKTLEKEKAELLNRLQEIIDLQETGSNSVVATSQYILKLEQKINNLQHSLLASQNVNFIS